ncbi:MAG: UDP-N-acetylmuramoyl-L-alanine--D-glutamate ligase [Elusimicrobia bacterium]|nr:UDP-N-acetylmuramoyl-L-alanine--D-glutamate ligase [Elusimicrobiota bacterium]
MRGQRIGILGAGRSGVACANLVARLGGQAFLSEAKPAREVRSTLASLDPSVQIETAGHTMELLKSQWLVKSPGVPPQLDLLKKARRRRIPIWSELEFASRLVHPRWMISVTGTNGKTTTTALIGWIAQEAGWPTVLAGNIGTPLSGVVDRVHSETVLVLEVSSYQLEDTVRFHPHVAVLLNVTEDHLDHHGTWRAYVQAKARLFQRQTRADVAVFNTHDACCRRLARRCRSRVLWFGDRGPLTTGTFGVWWEGERLWVRSPVRSWAIGPSWSLPGAHNRANAAAAVAALEPLKIEPAAVAAALERFPGLPHRLQVIRRWRGVTFINDSKATNVDSTRVALEALTGPLLLILGGRGKGTPFTSLRPLVRRREGGGQKVKAVFTIGEASRQAAGELRGTTKIIPCGTLTAAVAAAAKQAVSGDIVLLSPACASFDQFQDFEDRGRQFETLVNALPDSPCQVAATSPVPTSASSSSP